MMTIRERLDEIRTLKNQHDYVYADKQADALYEDITMGNVKVTDDEYHELFLYIASLSKHIYG